MFRNSKILIAGLAAAGVATSWALAATQGTVGVTSQGTSTITAAKGNSVRISGLADVTFPPSLTTPAPISQTACVFASTGTYTITATSNYAAGTTFRLNDGATTNGADYINYSVGWYNVGSGGSATLLASGTQSNPITGASTTSTNCGGGVNAQFQITIDNGTFTSANANSFTDTLTLLVGAT